MRTRVVIMRTYMTSVLFLVISITVALSTHRATAQDGYDIDCAVILCMAGGWPTEPTGTCSGAQSYMIDRIKDGKSPIGVCSTSEGGEFDDFDIDYQLNDPTVASSYTCPEGSSLFLKNPTMNTKPIAFCYTSVSSPPNTGKCTKVYAGISKPEYADFWAKLTLSPGSAGEYISPDTYINLNENSAETPVSIADTIELPCEDEPGSDFDPSDVSTDVVPPPNPSCLQVVAQPSGQELCSAKWSILDAVGGNPADRDRVGCRSLSDGSTAFAIEEKTGSPNSLVQLIQPTPGVGNATAVRASAEMYIPQDYKTWSGGRLPFGIQIGSAACASGGCKPEKQTGSTVRTNYYIQNGTIRLQNYSYHLNRDYVLKDPGQHWVSRANNEGVYGKGADMTRTVPKGEWVTLTFDLKLNDVGKANGSSTLAAYDSKGKLIGSATHNNAVYRKEGWNITGFAMPDKFNDFKKSSPKSQERLYRNFKMAVGDALSPQCK